MNKKTLFITNIILVILLLYVFYAYADLRLRVAYAEEQIEIFTELSAKSSNASKSDVVLNLEYVRNYYPSGTKQRKGSFLDHVVENSRKQSIEEMEKIIESGSEPSNAD